MAFNDMAMDVMSRMNGGSPTMVPSGGAAPSAGGGIAPMSPTGNKRMQNVQLQRSLAAAQRACRMGDMRACEDVHRIQAQLASGAGGGQGGRSMGASSSGGGGPEVNRGPYVGGGSNALNPRIWGR